MAAMLTLAPLFLLAIVVQLATPQEPQPVVLLGNRLVTEVPLAEEMPVPIRKAAVVDFTTKQLSWVYDWAIIPHAPRACIVITGQEDFLLGIPPKTVAANLLQIAGDLSSRGITPILTTVIPLPAGRPENAAIAQCNAALLESAEDADVRLIDLARYFGDGEHLHPAFAADGNYLAAAGYRALADAVAAVAAGDRLQAIDVPDAAEVPVDPFDPSVLSRQRVERIVNASPAEANLVLLGDSITEGGGDWGERLGRNDVRNAGQGGYSTGQMLWLLDEAVLSARPRRVLMMGGINDLTIGVPPERLFANVEEIVVRLQEAGIEAVLQSTFFQRDNPGTQPIIARHNERLRQLAEQKGLIYLDVNRVLSDERGLRAEFTTDNTHLTEAGYHAWATLLRDHLDRHPL